MSERIGPHYEVVRELRRGAWVTVYETRHAILGRRTLVKWLNPSHSSDEELVGRLRREARLGAAVDHPHVARIHEVGDADDRPYVAIEWIEGEDLGELLERDAPLEPDLVLRLADQLLSGLGAIHQAGVVHRDISPHNVRVTPEGVLRITDFGLATGPFDTKYTLPGSVVGTPGYLSPEQASGREADERSDLFAVGVLVYEALTGKPLFAGGDVIAVLKAIRERQHAPLEETLEALPVGFDAWLAQLLAKRPEDRFASAGEARQALAPLLPSEHAQDSDSNPAKPGRQFRPGLAALLLALLILVPGYFARKALLPEEWLPASDSPLQPDTLQPVEGRTVALPATADSLLPAPDSSLIEQEERSAAAAQERSSAAGDTAAPPPVSENAETQNLDSAQLRTTRTAPDTSFPSETALPGSLEQHSADTAAGSPESASDSVSNSAPSAPGWVRVRTQPWAEVYVDAERKGTTPDMELFSHAPGEVRLVLDNPGFPPIPLDTVVHEGDTLRLTLRLLDYVAPLELTITPWARVFLDEQPLGETPLEAPVYLSPGQHSLRLVHPEFGVVTRSLVAKAGQTYHFEVDMPEQGTPFASSEEEGAP